jgi:hypothetical protein
VTEQLRESDESDPTLADDAPPRADDREVEDKSADNWGGNEPGWWSTDIEREERESETHAASVAGSSDSIPTPTTASSAPTTPDSSSLTSTTKTTRSTTVMRTTSRRAVVSG